MTSSTPRLTRARLESLLDGRSADAGQLSMVLAAAAAPANPRELTGLPVAMALFADAAALPVGITSDAALVYRARHTGTVGRLTVRGLGAVVAGTALSGLAVAAVAAVVTGSSPTHGNSASHTSHSSTDAPASGSDTAAPPSSDSSSDSARPSDEGTGSAPTPNLDGLCNAWLSRPSDAGKADQSAAFSVLITTAGGKDNVDGYCIGRLTAAGRKVPTRHNDATHPATPGQKSSNGRSGESHGNSSGQSSHANSRSTAAPYARPSKPAPLPPAVPSTASGG